jgi:hypothetical protein
MNTYRKFACGAIMFLVTTGICLAQNPSPGAAAGASTSGSDAPYTEGSVWNVSTIRTKAGMSDDYLRNLAKAWKVTLEEQKKQGLIVNYKVLIGEPANKDDFDVMLMVEFKNWAAFDNIRAKTDPIDAKVTGGQDQQRQASEKRGEIRELMGSKTMQEITLK